MPRCGKPYKDRRDWKEYNEELVIRGEDEREIVEIALYKINSLYGEDSIIRSFLTFVKKNRKEVFLYLDNPEVEKTSDKAEQHFSVQSWLFKHRFKTKDGLLRTSYWYHWYLSTGSRHCLKSIKLMCCEKLSCMVEQR